MKCKDEEFLPQRHKGHKEEQERWDGWLLMKAGENGYCYEIFLDVLKVVGTDDSTC
jgi:hypothetical protein